MSNLGKSECETQRRVIALFRNESSSKLAKARQIKQGMMQELLTGRIRLV